MFDSASRYDPVFGSQTGRTPKTFAKVGEATNER
jgi:hypothetical protein